MDKNKLDHLHRIRNVAARACIDQMDFDEACDEIARLAKSKPEKPRTRKERGGKDRAEKSGQDRSEE